MRRVLAFALLAAALVAAPVARLAAAAPCPGSAPMDCCTGMGDDDGSAPCPCALKPVPPPAPAVVGAAQVPVVVPAEAPLPSVTVEAHAEGPSADPVSPRARSAPLHLLYSVLLV